MRAGAGRGAVGAGCALALAGCASQPAPPVGLPAGAPLLPEIPAPLVGRPPLAPRAPAGRAAIGVVQRVRARNAVLLVSVTRVVDPQDAPGAALTPGTRAVGVFVRLVNNGPATYDSSATGDVELVASEPVTPLYAPAGTCRTATVDFEMRIVPGEVRTGCVAFSVPSAARLVAVRFSPHGAATRRLVWWIPR